VENDPAKGAYITIENKNKMIMPVILKIVQSDGQSATIRLPVEIWQRGGIWTIKYASATKINEVLLDPDHVLPDVNRKNNRWTAGK
jgi:hypothetical protein